MLADVTWRDTTRAETLAALDVVLDRILANVTPELPQAVQVTRSNGDSLTIILGARTGTVLSFVSASSAPPYLASVGDPRAAGVFTFYVAENHHSEAAARHVIGLADARDAVRRFVQMPSGLPDTIAWEQV